MSQYEEPREPAWLDGLLKGLNEGGFGLEGTALADLLWLSPKLRVLAGSNQAETVEKTQRQGLVNPSSSLSRTGSRREDRGRDYDVSGRSGDLFLPRIGSGSGGSSAAGRTFSTPAAGPLPGIPALIRAFRPLMRRGPSRIDHVVDVPGTIRRITEEDLWEPVLRPAQERWLSLSLVVDVARSMDLWRPAARELGRVLGQMGSFARVHLWSWDTQNGDLALSPGLQGPIPGNTRARPSELGDPSGPHLVIVLTDCVADAWENGKAAVRLADWSSDAHLVLAQILPEWLWNRTGLATALRVRVHSLWPFAPTSTLQVVPADPVVAMILRKRGAGKGETQVALPIVTFDPEPLARWAKAAAARQDSWVPGRSWQLSPPGKLGSAPSVKKQPPRADSTEDGEQLVPRFLAVATENARKLARLLAAAPVISLPVVRLVRDSMLPEARLVHEAEVLLSGLLNVVDNPPGADPEEVRYEFREGVRAQLLKSLPAPVARDVLEVLSDYVDQHLGQAGRFKTMLADPIATPGVIDPGENPIARVAAEILLRLGGDFARLVKVRKTSSRAGGASRAIGKERAVARQRKTEKLCFVVAPIGEEGSDVGKRSDAVLKILWEAVAPFGYQLVRTDKTAAPGMISHEIIRLLVEVPLVVADLTGANPSVYYELAIRHAVGKPIVQLIAKEERIPFNVADTRTIAIDTADALEARDRIKLEVEAVHQPGYVTTPISARAIGKERAVARQRKTLKDCFVVAPIGEEGSDVRKRSDAVLKILGEAVAPFGYQLVRADKIAAPRMIRHEIIRLLVEAPLVVADLTGANPNVYYELAIRHAVGKPIVQLIAKEERIPFDVADMRTIAIDTADALEARDRIKLAVEAVHQPGYRVTTPISAALQRPAVL